MSSDKSSKRPVNEVGRNSNEPMMSQNLPGDSASSTDDQPKTNIVPSSSSSSLTPGTPAESIAAIPKEIDPLDPFAKTNQHGEIVLFTSMVDIVYTRSGNFTRGKEGWADIIFYPEMGKIRLIVKEMYPCVISPCVKTECLDNERFRYDGCRVSETPGNVILEENAVAAISGYLFGEWNGVGFIITNEEKYVQFNEVIQEIKLRILEERLPTKVLPDDKNARLRLEFWFHSAMRPALSEIITIFEGNIWQKRATDPDTFGRGIVALVKHDEAELLEIVTCLGDSVTNCSIYSSYSIYFVLRISEIILPNGKHYDWEWFSSAHNERQACKFETDEDAKSFKGIIDLYAGAVKREGYWLPESIKKRRYNDQLSKLLG